MGKYLHLFFHLYICVTTILGMLILLNSCSKEAINISQDTEQCYLDLDLIIQQSRAVIDENTGAGTFETGDTVILFIGNHAEKQYKLVKQANGIWLPHIKKSDLKGIDPVFNAIYTKKLPINDINGLLSFDLGIANHDILTAHYQSTELSDLILLNFKHAMHQVRVNLSLPADRNQLPDVQIKTPSKCQISLLNGEVTPLYSPLTAIQAKLLKETDTAATYLGYVVPQSLAELREEKSWITVRDQEKSYTYAAPNLIGESDRLLSGYSSNINLKISEPTKPNEYANQRIWLHGITSPVYREEEVLKAHPSDLNIEPNKWYKHSYNWSDGSSLDIYWIVWKEGCGWYDCNKTYEQDGAEDDYLCWAAATSNVMHWWMDNNKDYIQAYDSIYKNTENFKKFPRPAAFNQEGISEIFKKFTSTFRNRGAGEGVNWFIKGLLANTSGLKDYNMEGFPGYFPEVFGKRTENLYTSTKALSKANFNNVVKKAIEEKKALTFTINGNHVMNIWGVEFDSEGYVNYIYYVDNNPNKDFLRAECLREPIIYKPDEIMGLKDQTHVGKIRITALGSVDLRRDIWNESFPVIHH